MKRLILLAATALIVGSTVSAHAFQRRSATGAEGAAEDLIAEGKCDEAIRILRKLAGLSGYEVSEYHLGQCLLTLAGAEHDAALAADMRKEAATWIKRAADSGFAEAEAAAVPLYLDGVGVEKDPTEAEKWLLLYRHNGTRLAIGLPDIAPDLRSRLDAALSDIARAQAQTRADNWAPAAPSDAN